ncbi:hypothetical protein OY671_011351, partial [Metschnikowia pulcherrima]
TPQRGRGRGAQSRQPDVQRHARDQGCSRRCDRRAHRCRARSLYQSWAGRADRWRRLCPQRCHGRGAGGAEPQPGGGRRGHHRPVRHDGRAHRRDPAGAGGCRAHQRADHVLRRQICLGLLWPVPRCGRIARSAQGRQEDLPDGPRQRRGSAARGGDGSGRGRG